MDIFQALGQLKNSDIAIYTEEGAREICTALSVPYPTDRTSLHWDTIEEARHMWGFNALFAPGNGVYGYQLIEHVANALGITVINWDFPSPEQTKKLLLAIEEQLINTKQLDVRHWWIA